MKTLIVSLAVLFVGTFRCDKHSTAFASAPTPHKYEVGNCVVREDELDLPLEYRSSVQKIELVTDHHYITQLYSIVFKTHWSGNLTAPIVSIDKYYTKMECPK